MTCPRCQQDNSTQQKFCGECGTPLTGPGAAESSYAELHTENERLGRSLGKALDQQTATAEILRVMSDSLTDVQPVFDTIVRCGLRLLGGYSASMMLLRDGDRFDLVAYTSTSAEADASLVHVFPMPLRSLPPGERAVRDRRPHAVEDVQTASDVSDVMRETGRARGWHSNLFIPMLREDVALGLISITRRDPGPFGADEIALIETFAAKAVIAIENVRLFNELGARNRALTEALERQTATAEILSVISSSPTGVQPTFDAIAKSAALLCRADLSGVHRFDGELIHFAAQYGRTAEELDAVRRAFPQRPSRASATARCIQSGAIVQIGDHQDDPDIADTLRIFRTVLAVPMLREGRPVGSISVARRVVNPFTDEQVDLLKTFADQAVIAIENVRLFTELQVANRELAAASQHKSQFLANMSHELRTPLNAILGFSEVLSERMFGALNEKQDEYLKDIHASGQHLLSLINDILDLSKVEAGRMELELTDFDLSEALANAVMLIRERAGRRGIAVNTVLDGRLGQMRADERKVRQVALNLLSNAIKFTPEGGRIEVTAVRGAERVEVSVSDTGVGIAPEDQEKVFEEFRQVGTADKKVEGTGLGLALSRKFIELHGGRIWVESEIGRGSTFTFTLPARREG